MGITIGEYLNKTERHFFKYGVLARFWRIVGTIFRSRRCLDKAVYYFDKRWDMMTALLQKRK